MGQKGGRCQELYNRDRVHVNVSLSDLVEVRSEKWASHWIMFAKNNKNRKAIINQICCLQRSGPFYIGNLFTPLPRLVPRVLNKRGTGRKKDPRYYFFLAASLPGSFFRFPLAGRHGWISIVYNYSNERHNETFLVIFTSFYSAFLTYNIS